MSKVLFLSIPSHGHMNPTLGLAAMLVGRGEEVTFFSAAEFKMAVEEIGAAFKCYQHDLNLFNKKQGPKQDTSAGLAAKKGGGLVSALLQPEKFIDDLLYQIGDQKFDYLIFSAAYPYASTIARILNIPSISSFAVFATLEELTGGKQTAPSSDKSKGPFGINEEIMTAFKTVRQHLVEKYKVAIPENLFDLFFNKGDLNIIYTSKYFIPNLERYDDSFIFVGPPIYNKKYQVAFPFEKLKGKKVIYISMGTIFSNHSVELNKLFFKSFADRDVVVVMAAYQVDVSQYEIPDNFIIRDYVPQLELLKYTSVAITHSGMNSMGDFLYHNVPFVAIPLGADQFYLANRAQELGATIVLDVNSLTTEILTSAVEKVDHDPVYRQNIKKISDSFIAAGGYEKAGEEIVQLKKKMGIKD